MSFLVQTAVHCCLAEIVSSWRNGYRRYLHTKKCKYEWPRITSWTELLNALL